MSISRSIRSIKDKKIATSLTSSSSSQSGGGRTLLQRRKELRRPSRSAKAESARTRSASSSSSSRRRRRFWRLSIKRDGEGKRRHRFPQHTELLESAGCVFSVFFLPKKVFRVFPNGPSFLSSNHLFFNFIFIIFIIIIIIIV